MLVPDFKHQVNVDGEWFPALVAEAKDANNGVFIVLDTSNDTFHTVEASRGTANGQFKAC